MTTQHGPNPDGTEAQGLVTTYADGTALRLTTDSPASHYGMPALRHEGCRRCGDMGPADLIPICAEPQAVRDLFGARTAAEVVQEWKDEIEAQIHEAFGPDNLTGSGWQRTDAEPAARSASVNLQAAVSFLSQLGSR